MRWFCALAALTLLVGLGCNSIKTLPMDRSEGGHLSPNPPCPLQGVPVMLRVPTHLDVTIEEVEYWQVGEESLIPLNQDIRGRHISTEIQYTEKMFLVDPKRVASGTGFYGFGFDGAGDNAGKGYLKSAAYGATDTTLSQTAALITNIAKAAGGAPMSAEGITAKSMLEATTVIPTTRTVAFRKFDINRPTVDEEVRCFCQQYLNACQTDCGQPPRYLPPERN